MFGEALCQFQCNSTTLHTYMHYIQTWVCVCLYMCMCVNVHKWLISYHKFVSLSGRISVRSFSTTIGVSSIMTPKPQAHDQGNQSYKPGVPNTSTGSVDCNVSVGRSHVRLVHPRDHFELVILKVASKILDVAVWLWLFS